VAGDVGDGDRVVTGVGVRVAGGGGVVVEEVSPGGAVEAGTHVDLPGGRVGPLSLVADLDGGAGGGDDLAPGVVGSRAGQGRAGAGEGADQVVVLIAEGQCAADGGAVDADEGAAGVAGVSGGPVAGELAGSAGVGQRNADGPGRGAGNAVEGVPGVRRACVGDLLSVRIRGV